MYSDLKPALLLGGHNLLNCLNKDKNYLPNWFLNVDEMYKAECYFWWPGHNLGRWWDAMLRLEESVDFLIPPEFEAAMLVNMRLFFDNPDSWCIQPDLYGGKDFALDMHSIRESLLALTGLIRRRNSVWAEKIAHRMLETIQRAARDDGEWNFEQFVYFRKCSKLPDLTCHPTGTSGRAIEALVLYYETTGTSWLFSLRSVLRAGILNILSMRMEP